MKGAASAWILLSTGGWRAGGAQAGGAGVDGGCCGAAGLQPVWWHASAADRNENMRALVSGPASST